MVEVPQQESQRQIRLAPVPTLHSQHLYSDLSRRQIHPDGREWPTLVYLQRSLFPCSW